MSPQSKSSTEDSKKTSWLAKAMSVEWLGQTLASIFWIVSVLLYDINSGGDWLQLLAGFSWLFANIASLTKTS